MSPGQTRLGPEPVELAAGRERRLLLVENTSRRVVRVSSHYPFERTNPRLRFDRASAAGFRLDIPAGDSIRWAPDEIREVPLVRYGGRLGAATGPAGEAAGPTGPATDPATGRDVDPRARGARDRPR